MAKTSRTRTIRRVQRGGNQRPPAQRPPGQRKPTRQVPPPPKGGAPWALLFWICWPAALVLGVWGGYVMRPPSPDQLKTAVRQLRDDLESSREEAASNKKAREEFEEQCGILREQLDEARTRAGELRAKVSELERKIEKMGAGGGEEEEGDAEGEGGPPSLEKEPEEEPKEEIDDLFEDDLGGGDLSGGMRMSRGEKVREIGPWKGRSDMRTPTFNTKGPWQLAWAREEENEDGEPAEMSISVFRPGVSKPVQTVNTAGKARGNVRITETGDFYLDVECNGCVWNAKARIFE